MSSFDRTRRLAILSALLCLSGCFRPLYGDDSKTGVLASLHATQVDPIPDRIGHYLRDALVFSLNGGGSPEPALYRLIVTPKEQIDTPVVSTVTGQATSGTLVADAHFTLYLISKNSILTQGEAFTSADYNRSLQEYANVTAAQDAETRVANSLADQIRLRISAYFANHPLRP